MYCEATSQQLHSRSAVCVSSRWLYTYIIVLYSMAIAHLHNRTLTSYGIHDTCLDVGPGQLVCLSADDCSCSSYASQCVFACLLVRILTALLSPYLVRPVPLLRSICNLEDDYLVPPSCTALFLHSLDEYDSFPFAPPPISPLFFVFPDLAVWLLWLVLLSFSVSSSLLSLSFFTVCVHMIRFHLLCYSSPPIFYVS